jgi:hypothetical protein
MADRNMRRRAAEVASAAADEHERLAPLDLRAGGLLGEERAKACRDVAATILALPVESEEHVQVRREDLRALLAIAQAYLPHSSPIAGAAILRLREAYADANEGDDRG